MKIAVCGTHRVGKTTLIEKLQEVLPDYECKIEAYYELEKLGISFSEEPVFEDYLVMLEHSTDQISDSGENTIFDRSPIDMLAYIQAVNKYKNFDIQRLYNRVKEIMIEIDLIVFVPIEKPDLIGCPESELPELRLEVNDILNDWIWDFNLNSIEVTGSPLARRDQVIKQILKLTA